MTFGSSGAPVFTHLNGRGRIFSVISAEAKQGSQDIAIGMNVAPIVEELKVMLRAGSTTAPIARINRVQVGTRTSGLPGGSKSVRVPGSKSVRVPTN